MSERYLRVEFWWKASVLSEIETLVKKDTTSILTKRLSKGRFKLKKKWSFNEKIQNIYKLWARGIQMFGEVMAREGDSIDNSYNIEGIFVNFWKTIKTWCLVVSLRNLDLHVTEKTRHFDHNSNLFLHGRSGIWFENFIIGDEYEISYATISVCS